MQPLSVIRARALSALLLGVAFASPAAAQTAPARAAAADRFDLSVGNIMRGERLVGRSPDEVRWSEDSRYVYFRWRDPESQDTTTHTYRVPAAGGTPERLADSVALRVAPTQQGTWAVGGRRRAVVRGGDVFVVEVTGRERRVTDTPTRERQPHLSPDGGTVYFLSGNNVYAVSLAGGPIRQLTDIRLDQEPEDAEAKGHRKYLEEQQAELFGVVRDRVREREHREALDSARTRVRATYLGKKANVASAEVSPSGRYVLLGVGERTEGKEVLVPNFVTESGYTENLSTRSKVGDVQAGQRAGILDLATGKIRWVEQQKDRKLSTITVGWAPRTDRALLIAIPADYKDRWIYTVTPDGAVTTVDHLRDDAWVGGPGLFTAGWLPDGERVYFVSEKTGHAHLYTVPATGGEARALTSGKWEVTGVQLATDGRTFYITTSETHPGERDLYSIPAQGGPRTRITAMGGWNDGTVSPDGRRVAVLHSESNRPPELFLQPVAGVRRAARQVTASTTAEFRRGPWIQPEVVAIPARDGEPVYARVYRPQALGVQPNGAGVLFVHGAGYLQNAHKGWSTYFREYMFNHLLASRGYTVLDVDYRGSAGYGRDWRTGIYRHMGGKDLTDHVDAAAWMAKTLGVDPKRIGIYGGSYGGFITLMGLFKEPEVFRSGAALRSVTDWAHYNHWYTSRILNQPQDDPEAYRRSSPIYFAEGLKGDLLIAHGMVDTNVHFSDVVRLSQRLIELGKTNWEMAVYPVEDHAFVRPESWTDEYRRIYELFERTLKK